jgi:hypothetical protein
VTVWGALAGGFVGTIVFTSGLRAATELRLTRMDIPFLLGTAVFVDRVRAKAAGYLMHGVFAGTALINILLPVVHPRMGSTTTAADASPVLEPAGFLLLNYGTSTPLVTLIVHIVYGAIVGEFVALSS